MKQPLYGCAALAAVLASVAVAADWPMLGGNPQRNGWAASEQQITPQNIAGVKLLYRYQSDNESRGSDALTAPIINGNLITYLGFKEMLMFSGSADKVYSVDADLNQLIWKNQFPFAAKNASAAPASDVCSGGMTAPMVMAGSSSNALHFESLASRAPAAAGVKPPRRQNPYLPTLAHSLYPMLPTTLTQLNSVYTVTSDGFLHVVNSSTGQDLIPSVRFLPPHARVASLNLRDNVVYATTADNCDGFQNAIYAIDLLSPEKAVTLFAAPEGGFAGSAGTSIGNDGTIYVQMAFPKDGSDKKHLVNAVVALTPRQLQVKDYVVLDNKVAKAGEPGITPVVFSFSRRDLIVAASPDGRMVLLDSRSLGGSDHRTPLFATEKNKAAGLNGVFSTWVDVESGTRYIYASVSRKGSAALIAAKVAGDSDHPTLETMWSTSSFPQLSAAVIANQMLFAVSPGDAPGSAVLRAFTTSTGKNIYASQPVSNIGKLPAEVTLANGRVYFVGHDNAVYCFGIPSQHSQLFNQ